MNRVALHLYIHILFFFYVIELYIERINEQQRRVNNYFIELRKIKRGHPMHTNTHINIIVVHIIFNVFFI